MSNHYKLRITPYDVSDISKFDDLLKNYCTTVMRVREGDGEYVEYHYHYYLIVSGKYNTLRSKLKELIYMSYEGTDKKPSRCYAFNKLKLGECKYASEYVRYMCKDGLPVDVKGTPVDWISKGVEEAEEFRKNAVEEKKEKGGTFKKIVKMLDDSKCYVDGNWNGKKVVLEIIDFYISNQTKFTRFGVESIATTYMCMRNPNMREQLAQSIYLNIK